MGNNTNSNDDDEIVVMESSESEMIDSGFNAEIAKKNEEEFLNKQSTKRKNKKIKLDPQFIKILMALLIAIAFFYLGFNELSSIENNQKIKGQQAVEVKAKNIAKIIEQKIIKLQHKFVNLEISTNTKQLNDNVLYPAGTLYLGTMLHYFTLPIDHFSIVDNPAQGNVFLDLIIQLQNSKKKEVSSLEILKANTKYEKVILGKKINKGQEKGIAIALLPKQYIQDLINDLDTKNSKIRITQGQASTILLATKGNIVTGISKKLKIDNTLWNIEYINNEENKHSGIIEYWLIVVYLFVALLAIVFSIVIGIKIFKNNKLEKNKKNESLLLGTSILNNKESISKLGMKKSEVLSDKKQENNQKIENKIKTKEPKKTDNTVFTDYGIRGIVGDQISNSLINSIGHSIAEEMEINEWANITLGHDGRSSSKELYNVLINSFKSYSIKIIDLGLATLPVVYYCAITETNGCSVMITGGSSSAEINGLKILLNFEIVSQSKLSAYVNEYAKEYMREQEATETNDLQLEGQDFKIEQKDINHLYINSITEQFNYKKTLKIVVDCSNGVASLIIIDLLKMLDCNVIAISNNIDGKFSDHQPHPAMPENFKNLTEKVKSESADIGFIFNGDGSAIGVVSSAGEIIWADRVLMLIARSLLKENIGAKILYDVKSSSSLHEWIIEHQGEPEITPSGCGPIKQRMDMNNALLAGEFSGHFYQGKHARGLDDAFYTAANLCQIVSDYGSSSENLFKEIPSKISTPEILIAVQPGKKQEILEKITAIKDEFMPAAIITLDGIRVEYEDGWGVVRESKTSSSLSLRFEAESAEVLQRIAEKFKEVILSVVFVKFPY